MMKVERRVIYLGLEHGPMAHPLSCPVLSFVPQRPGKSTSDKGVELGLSASCQQQASLPPTSLQIPNDFVALILRPLALSLPRAGSSCSNHLALTPELAGPMELGQQWRDVLAALEALLKVLQAAHMPHAIARQLLQQVSSPAFHCHMEGGNPRQESQSGAGEWHC